MIFLSVWNIAITVSITCSIRLWSDWNCEVDADVVACIVHKDCTHFDYRVVFRCSDRHSRLTDSCCGVCGVCVCVCVCACVCVCVKRYNVNQYIRLGRRKTVPVVSS